MTQQEQVLDYLKRSAEAIALMFGPNCETLIHDMSKPGHPILAIYNGHVSGRSVGSTADIFGGDIYSEGSREHFKRNEDDINTLAVTKSGHHVKSTTIQYVGKGYHYAFGINYDYECLAAALPALESLVQSDLDLDKVITENTGNQLDTIFADCVRLVGKPVDSMSKSDRIQMITLLNERGAFSFQKSVSYVAEQMHLSRYTIYKYLHEIGAEV